jgi:2-polyprenyl-3-methyl-5-hydroxy-6-metoxy-1,4-benzoquinol methylase
MQEVVCKLCGEKVGLKVFKTLPDLIKCKKCGLVYLVKPFERSLKESIYDNESYYEHLIAAQEDDVEHSRFPWKGYLSFLEKKINKGKLLDIGCGTGFFLNWAKRRGWQVWGLDPSEFACRYASQNYGLNIFNAELSEINFSEEFFDVVTLWSVIEHVQEPLNLLLEVNRILKKKGMLGLSVPNIGSWEAKIFKERWGNLSPGHLYYFDIRTIKLLLKKTGFVPVKITTIGGLGIRTHLGSNKLRAKNLDYNHSSCPLFEFGNNLIKSILSLFKKGGILIVWAVKS